MKTNLKNLLAGLSAFALISTTTPAMVHSYSLDQPKLVVKTEDRDIHVDVNNHSKLVYTRYDNQLNLSKIVANKDGMEKILTQRHRDLFPTFSPKGDKIAFYRGFGSGFGLLYVMDSDGKHLDKLTVTKVTKPSWNPDGKSIAVEDMLITKEHYIT